MKQFVLFIILTCWAATLNAQQQMVECFAPQLENVPVTVRDFNDEVCARINIYSLDKIQNIEGNVFGKITEAEDCYTIYVTNGTKEIKLNILNHLPLLISFHNYIGRNIKSGEAYDIILTKFQGDLPIEKTPTELNLPFSQVPADFEKWLVLFNDITNGNPSKGITPTPSAAVYLVRKLSCQNHPAACILLGVLYDGTGENGVVPNDKKAFQWYKRGAAVDSTGMAKAHLAECYLYGHGTSVDEQKAKECLFSGGYQDGLGMQILGDVYQEGRLGEKKDAKKAFNYFLEAAKKGYDYAQLRVAIKYFFGDGITKNEEEGVKWATESANNGNSKAAALLEMYKNRQK